MYQQQCDAHIFLTIHTEIICISMMCNTVWTCHSNYFSLPVKVIVFSLIWYAVCEKKTLQVATNINSKSMAAGLSRVEIAWLMFTIGLVCQRSQFTYAPDVVVWHHVWSPRRKVQLWGTSEIYIFTGRFLGNWQREFYRLFYFCDTHNVRKYDDCILFS